jgi:hypothetical protein
VAIQDEGWYVCVCVVVSPWSVVGKECYTFLARAVKLGVSCAYVYVQLSLHGLIIGLCVGVGRVYVSACVCACMCNAENDKHNENIGIQTSYVTC